jgi:hypothetical protein
MLASGVWGIWDGGVMSWKATDLSENEAKRQAADLNVTFKQYGQRNGDDRRQVSPPVPSSQRRGRRPVNWTTGCA